MSRAALLARRIAPTTTRATSRRADIQHIALPQTAPEAGERRWMTFEPDNDRPRLRLVGVSKTFGGVSALDGVDLGIGPGEVHALLGENGSGKSTLIKVLSGYHVPDSGSQILVDGHDLRFGDPLSSYTLGCRFVHQDLGLIDSLSVADNLALGGGYPRRWGTIRVREFRRQVRLDLARVGLALDGDLPVGGLSPAVKTGVAVARALRDHDGVTAKVLVLDEPTATLPDEEVHQLLGMVRAVAASGVSVIYVTHRLEEVFGLAHKVTVLRDGRKVLTEAVENLSRDGLVAALVGRDFDEVSIDRTGMRDEEREPLLEIRNLTAGPIENLSFDVGPGEILGIAGITGSGRETLLGTLFGAGLRESGTVSVDGEPVQVMRPDISMAMGIAYLPPDRKVHGAIMDASARENLSLSDLRPFRRCARLVRKLETEEARRWFTRLDIRSATGPEQVFSTFSGGNQQKILFGKWLRRAPRVLLLDEPTQGVDVAAKAQLHHQIVQSATLGAAVIVSSSEAEELAALCHRIVVLASGQLVAELTGEEISVATIVEASLAVTKGTLV